jgi:tRNA(Ile2)-agmatinylcytidine synthase
MRLGVDDTDGPEGGCTTHLLTELVALGRSEGLDVLGEPNLVRLNPNVPWKTRGNAALAVTLGHGTGPAREIGVVEGTPVLAFARGRAPTSGERDRFAEDAWIRVCASSSRSANTDPALVIGDGPLPESLYRSAVTAVVDPNAVEAQLHEAGAWFRTMNSNRGLVGAAAAVAWPGRRRTWELISYRAAGATGPRSVDNASVLDVARREPDLFLCHDPRTRRLLVAPHTPCPILFGLRSRSSEAALRARVGVRSEPVGRWMLFRTNQGTGDHLRAPPEFPLAPFTPAKLRGTLVGRPSILRGGHVGLRLDTEGIAVDCRVFEPTKALPAVARELREGDEVELWGGTGPDPTFRVEGIRVLRLATRASPPLAPTCPSCDRRAGSLGTARGYRCGSCRRRWPPEAATRRPGRAGPARGTYHPTPSARRHLAPLGPEPLVASSSA